MAKGEIEDRSSPIDLDLGVLGEDTSTPETSDKLPDISKIQRKYRVYVLLASLAASGIGYTIGSYNLLAKLQALLSQQESMAPLTEPSPPPTLPANGPGTATMPDADCKVSYTPPKAGEKGGKFVPVCKNTDRDTPPEMKLSKNPEDPNSYLANLQVKFRGIAAQCIGTIPKQKKAITFPVKFQCRPFQGNR